MPQFQLQKAEVELLFKRINPPFIRAPFPMLICLKKLQQIDLKEKKKNTKQTKTHTRKTPGFLSKTDVKCPEHVFLQQFRLAE